MRYHESIADEVASKNKADSFRGFLDDIPIYVMNFEGSGKNKYYTSAREAGKDFFDRDMTNASRSDSWVARNCLAGALKYDIDEHGDLSLRDKAYGHEWEVTFPESLPSDLIKAYALRNQDAVISQKDILQKPEFSEAFSSYVMDNFEEYDIATAAGQDIILPVKYQEVWEKGKDYNAKDKNSSLVEKVPYLSLREVLLSLGFERNNLGTYTHVGDIDGDEKVLSAVRYAKALYDNKVKFVPDSDEIYANIEAANQFIAGKYDWHKATIRIKTERAWGKRFKDDPSHVKITKYSVKQESRKR